MSEQDAMALLDILYPYFIKKYKEDNSFKQIAKVVNGTVEAVTATHARVKINPYDKETIEVPFPTKNTIDILGIKSGDSVLIMYYDSLKNAKIIAKN